MGSLIIKSPVLSVNGPKARIHADLIIDGEHKQLWFECPAEFSKMISSETSDSFLLSVFATAVQKGLNITVEGAVSSRLYYNMSNYLTAILCEFLPDSKRINISAEHLTQEQWGKTGVFTAFSAGIDSFCTIIEHWGSKVPPEYRVTHFLYNDVGGHGKKEDMEKIFHERISHIKPSAEKMGRPLIVVKSNIDDITCIAFPQEHTLRNAAVSLLFQKGCSKFLYSSTFPYSGTFIRRDKDVSHLDPFILPLLSTETTECISSGSQYTRVQKTKIVAASEDSYQTLDVCLMPLNATKTNCSRCYKCLRTQLTFEICGALSKYSDVFDLPTYYKYRWLYICQILKGPDIYLKDISNAIKEYNFPIPLSAKIVGNILPNKLIELVLVSCTWAQSKNPVIIFGLMLMRWRDALPRIKKQLCNLLH